MKVFISWSGERSKAVAEALRYWLPKVIQAIEPWMSSDDIEKGTRWRAGIAAELEQSSVGIICLTRENLDSTWIHFEAGALSKQQDNTYVCTLLYDLEPTDVREPLAQFQATKFERGDLRKLVFSINNRLEDSKLAEPELEETFGVWWPRLEDRLNQVRTLTIVKGPVRTDRELLEEILNLVRTHESRREVRADEGDELLVMYLDWVRALLTGDPKVTTKAELEAALLKMRERATPSRQWGRMLEEYLTKAERGETEVKKRRLFDIRPIATSESAATRIEKDESTD